MGPIVLPGLEEPEQTVPKMAEVFLPGVLHIAFLGAVISAIVPDPSSTVPSTARTAISVAILRRMLV